MAVTHIQFVNQSTVWKPTATEMAQMAVALQLQANLDVAPHWETAPVTISVVDHGVAPLKGAWVIGFFDNADQAGALGYHDVTPDGLPLAKIFCKDTLDAGEAVSSVTSHELVEMLGDPNINLLIPATDTSLWDQELCDMVEAYSYAGANGVKLSDFCLPAAFQPGSKGPWDFKGHMTGPMEILKGGYIGVLGVGSDGKLAWSQQENFARAFRAVIHPGSRRERRRRGRANWQPSTY